MCWNTRITCVNGGLCVYTLYKEIKPMGYNGSYPRLTIFMAGCPKTTLVTALPPAQKGANFSTRSLGYCFLPERR